MEDEPSGEPDREAARAAADAAVTQFQRAALDAVDAARAVLDAAESMIKEPAAIEAVVDTINAITRSATDAVAKFAGSAVRESQRPDDDHPDDPDEGYHDISVH